MTTDSEQTRDGLIIGSGAAGGAAAFHMAAAGYNVLLLERDAATRIKPCGGGMAASVQQWFPFSLEPAVEQVIAFWCDGSRGLYIHPGIWHDGIYPVADHQRFLDRQGRVHARVSCDLAFEFGLYLSVPLSLP